MATTAGPMCENPLPVSGLIAYNHCRFQYSGKSYTDFQHLKDLPWIGQSPRLAAVTESGNPVQDAEGVHKVEEREGSLIIELGSGRYRFEIAR